MSNRLAAAVVPLLAALALAACGDDATEGEAGTTAAAVTEAENDGTTAMPATTTTPPATTAAAITTVAATTTTIGPGFVEVIVNADDPSSYGAVEQVPLGSPVVLRLLSTTPREYHVHGYDLESQAEAGVEKVFEFTADLAGTFEVEDHETGDVLVVLQVA